MPDEPTLGELMRRLDDAIRQITTLAQQMADDRAHAAQTYVRADVYAADRRLTEAAQADMRGDISTVAAEVKSTEQKRSANVRWAVGVGLGLASLLVAVIALFVNGGPVA